MEELDISCLANTVVLHSWLDLFVFLWFMQLFSYMGDKKVV